MAKSKNPKLQETTDIPVEEPVTEEVPKTATVNCDLLNVRTASSLDSEVLTVVSKNYLLTLNNSKCDKGWTGVTLSDGTEGFVMTKFIK